MSSRETSRGLGSYRRGGFSGLIFFGSMLRPNSVPAAPMSGSFKSFHMPSVRRAVRASAGGSSVASVLIFGPASNRFMSRRSRRWERRFSALSEVVGSCHHWRLRLMRLNTACMARLESDLLMDSAPPRAYGPPRRASVLAPLLPLHRNLMHGSRPNRSYAGAVAETIHVEAVPRTPSG